MPTKIESTVNLQESDKQKVFSDICPVCNGKLEEKDDKVGKNCPKCQTLYVGSQILHG